MPQHGGQGKQSPGPAKLGKQPPARDPASHAPNDVDSTP